MAHVKEPYGLAGKVKLYTYSDDPGALAGFGEWWLNRATSGEPRWHSVTPAEVGEHGGGLIAKFPGVDDRDAALVIRGTQIAVPRSLFPEHGESEFYWSELIGLAVSNRDGVRLGQVENLLDLGPHQVLRITGADRERLIPFVAQYVDGVDVAGGAIRVDWGVDY